MFPFPPRLGTNTDAPQLHQRKHQQRNRNPRKPVAKQLIHRPAVRRRHIGDQCRKRSSIAAHLAHNPAPVVAHRQEAVLRRARQAEAVFHSTHHRDVPVPATDRQRSPTPAPASAPHRPRRRDATATRSPCPCRSPPPFSVGRGSVTGLPGFRFDSNGGSMCCLS